MNPAIRPIWSLLAYLFPLCAALMVWKVWRAPANGNYGAAFAGGVVLVIFGGAGAVLGGLSAVIGLVRGEPWAWLAWLALVVNLGFLVWLYMQFR